MKIYVCFFILSTPLFAWPPVDIPSSDKLHYFAAVSGPIQGEIREEIRFAANVPPRLQSDSGRYGTLHPAIPTPYYQPFPSRVPITVHILRVVRGQAVMGWVAHVNNYLFEYFQKTEKGYRFSLRIQTDDDSPAPPHDRDVTRRRAIRNFHIVREEGRWGFSERMGLNPFEGGNWATLDTVLGVADVFESVPAAQPPSDLGERPLRLASGEEPLWTDEAPPLLTPATCAQRLGLKGLPGMDTSWMFPNLFQ